MVVVVAIWPAQDTDRQWASHTVRAGLAGRELVVLARVGYLASSPIIGIFWCIK